MNMRRHWWRIAFVVWIEAIGKSAGVIIEQSGPCNGHKELCNRGYGNITFAGAHDSFAHSEDPLALARTQSVNITTQLELGIRLLQAQSHFFDEEIHFCHTSCYLFDGGPVLDYLKEVKSFLDNNPREVVTVLFTNPEGLSANNIWLPVFNSSGIIPYAYTPPSQPLSFSEWPTLGELIQNNTRLVVFFDYPGLPNDTVPFINYEFHNIWETPFDETNDTFPCSVNRWATPPSVEDHMYMINHYLSFDIFGITIPDRPDASGVNSVESILNNSYQCAELSSGRAPNFVLLDWVDQGQVMKAVNRLNGLKSSKGQRQARFVSIDVLVLLLGLMITIFTMDFIY